MECDFEGCNKMSCASTSVWLKTGGLHVKYWCKEHTPQDDTSLDWHCWANAMTVGCCNECELEAAEQPLAPDAACTCAEDGDLLKTDIACPVHGAEAQRG